MGPISTVVAWIGFGIVAGIVAMILPYHRGARGIVVNLGGGILGALFGGLLGYALGIYRSIEDTTSFLLAAVGAIVALGSYHAYWSSRHIEKRA
jgi:uncharacterized membrane protein YeaQ/YmgE (transglycosylase-associated protein family)